MLALSLNCSFPAWQDVGMPASLKRARDRERTQLELESALKALVEEKSPVTITAVAARANVSPGLIHNTYPSIAAKIRAVSKRAPPKRLDLADALSELRAENERLAADLRQAELDIKKLGSEAATLREECKELRAQLTLKVVPLKAIRRR